MSTFVGFGFGPIQAGLFLYEAQQSGAFDRLVVAEIAPERVNALRRAGGVFHLNIAHADRIERISVGPAEIYNPHVEADRAALVDAVAQAAEIATAIPSVRFYAGDGPGSVHRVLAAGIARKHAQKGPQAVVYAAENNNHAAEILTAAVEGEMADPPQARRYVNFLNTVVGKMSGVKPAGGRDNLVPFTPSADESFLVEAFNHILVTRPSLPRLPNRSPYARQITVFDEKDDLLPFEEAKLYGHNALHATAAYLGWMKGLDDMAQLSAAPDILLLARRAAQDEAGAALCRRYAGLDPLFTQAGFAEYVDDLLLRMVNPYLRDAIERVARDPARKLAWHDRLIGAMRLALTAGREPEALAMGAAAAYAYWAAIDPALANRPMAATLSQLWAVDQPDETEQDAILLRLHAAGKALAARQA